MSRSADERLLTEQFEFQYQQGTAPVMLDIERDVLGSDYGGVGYTTRREAERLSELLGLEPGIRLLDVGAGSGWPGVYLAKTSGCDIALVDPPLEGLRTAGRRAAAERLRGTCWIAVAEGGVLPFKDDSFDAILHLDVLC